MCQPQPFPRHTEWGEVPRESVTVMSPKRGLVRYVAVDCILPKPELRVQFGLAYQGKAVCVPGLLAWGAFLFALGNTVNKYIAHRRMAICALHCNV